MATKAIGLGAALLALALSAGAQLSSPVPGVQPLPKGTATGAVGPTGGTGPGVHSPNSPFAPLPQRTDVVPWSVLTSVKTRVDKSRILPVFDLAQLGLHQKVQRIQGFMMPLEPGERQRHFLLSSVPLTCSFCTPGGPESMVEVKTKTPVPVTMEPVVVEGRFLVLHDDPYGLYYRVTDAVGVK